VVGLVVVLLTALGVGGWALRPPDVPGRALAADAPNFAPGPLDGDGPLTEADLAAVDPDRLLDEFLLALLTQPVLHVRMESIGDVPAYLSGAPDYNHGFVESGFDFRTNKLAYHRSYGFDTICVDDAVYGYDTFDAVWEEEPGSIRGCDITTGSEDAAVSSSLDLAGIVNAGVLTSGLTMDESRAYVDALRRDYPGFLVPGELGLAEHDGEQYLRMPVVYQALDLGGSTPYGMAIFSSAFDEIGPRAGTHVLLPGTAGAWVSQVEAVYYLDPTSRLPAYAEVLIYEPADDPTATGGDVHRIEYVWDGKLPHPDPATASETPPPPSWPAERFRPSAAPR
jgi:hypothetical protein